MATLVKPRRKTYKQIRIPLIPEDAASLAGLLKATTFATEQDLIRYGALPFYLSLLVAKDGGRNCIVLEDTIKRDRTSLRLLPARWR